MPRSQGFAARARVQWLADFPAAEWRPSARYRRRCRKVRLNQKVQLPWCGELLDCPGRCKPHTSSGFHLRFSARHGAACLPGSRERCELKTVNEILMKYAACI